MTAAGSDREIRAVREGRFRRILGVAAIAFLCAAVAGSAEDTAGDGRSPGGSDASRPAPPAKSLLPGGEGGWELVWRDEFDYPDAALTNGWISQNGPSGHILSSRWRENAVVSNGMLRLVARKEKRGGQEWTAGSLWTKRTFQYGYFECRYRYAAAEGLNNSFWIMPKSGVPPGRKHFEIDINEGHFPDEVNSNIHNHTDRTNVNGRITHPTSSRRFVFGPSPDRGRPAGKTTPGRRDGEPDFAREFHVFGLEWTDRELVFYLDGRELRREKNDICHSPAPVWLSLAVISWGGRVTDAIDGKAMEVDYVRVYRRKP